MAKLAEKTFSRETFSHKPNVKTGRVVPSNLWPEKDILKLLRRIYIKMPWQSKQEALRLVNCMTAIWIITSNDHQNRRRCTSLCRWLEETKHWSLASQRPLPLLHNLLTASNQPLSSCCCSQLVPINVLRHPDATFSQSSSPSEPPHSKQPTSVQLLLLAASSNKHPQTPWCHLQSVQAPRSTSQPSRSSPYAQAQAPELLQGRFASWFQQDGRTWASDHESSATRGHPQHRK